ncbi:MAG: glycosyltransferase [Bacteroidales bacterium]|nr:glycosyltransferase [Bacteroidales bacterium]
MKILFVVNNYFATGNGLSASARRTVQALKDAGQDVRVLSGPNPDAAGPRPEYLLQKYNFPIFQPLISAHGYQFAAGDMAKIEEAISWADVVHLEEPFVLDIRAIKVAKKLGKPITGTYHLHPENIFYSIGLGWWKGINRALLAIWRDWVFDHCSYLQCPTQNVQERLVRHNFKSTLETFSNGLVPDRCLRPENPPADYFDAGRPLKVLYIGRLSVEKDQPTLIRAMRYSKMADRIQLHFAGQGPRAKAYKHRAHKLYQEGVLKYDPLFTFNTRDELRTLAAEADLCIHCATVEVEGLSIMEAIQQGAVPVIAAGWHTGTSQFALDSRSVFPEKDAKALAEKIDWWLSHPEERWEAGKAYAASMEHYDIANSAQKLITMFNNAIAANK